MCLSAIQVSGVWNIKRHAGFRAAGAGWQLNTNCPDPASAGVAATPAGLGYSAGIRTAMV
jgi:hypothetical protein